MNAIESFKTKIEAEKDLLRIIKCYIHGQFTVGQFIKDECLQGNNKINKDLIQYYINLDKPEGRWLKGQLYGAYVNQIPSFIKIDQETGDWYYNE